MNEIMKTHNGKFGFTDETGWEGIQGDDVTTIELTFPIEIRI
jgi:type I restriction enzyme M protein